MSSHRPRKKDIESLCSQVGPEDGIDPRYLSPGSGRPVGRKQLQLGRQVRDTLLQALPACGNDVLRELEVVSVTPAAGAGRLLVVLRPSPSASPHDLPVFERHLAGALGFLCNEVARAVHRRKAPELVVRLIERSP